MTLALRANQAAAPSNSNLISKVLADPWHPDKHPAGYISLGLAENSLMHGRILEKIKDDFALPENVCTYGDGFTGSRRLKQAISSLVNRHFSPVTPVQPEHIIVTNGCSAALEQLAWAIADPGDAFLLGRPFYTRLNIDPSLRTGASVLPVSFDGADPLMVPSISAYEQAYLDAKTRGQKVAGVLLCNPHNPLGRCYPRASLLELLRFCQRYRLHVIADEIYALSVWSHLDPSNTSPVPFKSCLALAMPDIIDPALVHVAWGMSKDFGANGFRVGAIISQHNKVLHSSLQPGAILSSVSSISDYIACKILQDEAWIDDYILENQHKLLEHYNVVTKWAREHGIPCAKVVDAAFFLWIDLGTAFRARHGGEKDRNVDAEVTQALERQKVFVSLGKAAFGAEKHGWFRLVFSVERIALEEGLKRVLAALA